MINVTSPCPFQGLFVVQGLELAMINVPTKFEVFISTHYEDAKRDTKCENGIMRWFGMIRGSPKVTENRLVPFDRMHEFLLTFHSNYNTISLSCTISGI